MLAGAGLATNSSLRIPVGAGLAANGKESQQQISIRLEVAGISRELEVCLGFQGKIEKLPFRLFFSFRVPDSPHRCFVILTIRMDPKPGELSILGRNKLSSHVPEKTNK